MADRKLTRTRHDGVYRRGDSYYWVVDVGRVDGKRKQRTGTAPNLKQAKADRDQVVDELRGGTYVANTKLTLSEYVSEVWVPSLASGELAPNSVSYYRGRMAHVLPVLGSVRLSDLNAASFDRLWQQLASQGMSKASLQGTKIAAHKCLDHARRKGVVARNVVGDSDLPKVDAAERTEWWSASELGTWVRSTRDDRLHALWAVLASTGMRRGEALALRWSDIDESKVTITKSRTRTAAGPAEGQPKTQAGKRVIGLDARTQEALARWRKVQAAEKLAFGPGYNPEGHVFVDEAGRALNPDRVSRLFRVSARQAGLRPIKLHAVRHSYASAAIAAGMAPVTLSRRLGHSKIQVTIDLYCHVSLKSDQDFADAMGEVLWGADPVPLAQR